MLKGLVVNGNVMHKGAMAFDIYTLFDTTTTQVIVDSLSMG